MSTLATADYAAQDYAADVPPLRVSVESLRCLLLWLTGFSGAFVFIEPSPYEVMSLFTATIFVISGLTLQAALIPLLALLFFYNLGFWIAVVPVINEEKTLSWVLISGYLSVTAIFFAAMLAKNTQQRLSVLCSGFTLGAIIAALAGIAGYFHLVPQFSRVRARSRHVQRPQRARGIPDLSCHAGFAEALFRAFLSIPRRRPDARPVRGCGVPELFSRRVGAIGLLRGS